MDDHRIGAGAYGHVFSVPRQGVHGPWPGNCTQTTCTSLMHISMHGFIMASNSYLKLGCHLLSPCRSQIEFGRSAVRAPKSEARQKHTGMQATVQQISSHHVHRVQEMSNHDFEVRRLKTVMRNLFEF